MAVIRREIYLPVDVQCVLAIHESETAETQQNNRSCHSVHARFETMPYNIRSYLSF